MSKETGEEKSVELKKADEGAPVNVAEQFEKITAIVGQVREAIGTLKESEVKIKDWHFAFDKMEEAYAVEFTLKLTVTPRETAATQA